MVGRARLNRSGEIEGEATAQGLSAHDDEPGGPSTMRRRYRTAGIDQARQRSEGEVSAYRTAGGLYADAGGNEGCRPGHLPRVTDVGRRHVAGTELPGTASPGVVTNRVNRRAATDPVRQNRSMRTDQLAAQGLHGLQGLAAAQGLHGLAAAQGLQGLTAAQGLQGLTAAQGLQGLAAAHGLHGLQGLAAAHGLHGLQGVAATAAWGLSPEEYEQPDSPTAPPMTKPVAASVRMAVPPRSRRLCSLILVPPQGMCTI